MTHPFAEFESLTSLFINLGFGSAVTAALIWFLMYMVKVTLPNQQAAFLTALKDEQDVRRQNQERMLGHLGVLIRSVRRSQRLTLDRIDVSFKQLVTEMQALADRSAAPPPPDRRPPGP